MPTLDFNFDLANLIGDAVRVLIILVMAFIFLDVLKKVIPRRHVHQPEPGGPPVYNGIEPEPQCRDRL